MGKSQTSKLKLKRDKKVDRLRMEEQEAQEEVWKQESIDCEKELEEVAKHYFKEHPNEMVIRYITKTKKGPFVIYNNKLINETRESGKDVVLDPSILFSE